MAKSNLQLHQVVEESKDDVMHWHVDVPVSLSTEEHSHSKGQLFSLKSGLALVQTSTGVWALLPNRCCWIPPSYQHCMRSLGKISGWSLYLPAAACASLPQKPTVLPLSPLVEQISIRISEWKHDPPAPATRRHLITVLRDEIRNATTESLHLPMPIDPRLKRLADEMLKHLGTNRSLDDWARFAGMSKRSLLRNFQRETGMTIGQWFQHLRMFVALEKLSRGSSVTQTALAVGFRSVSAFIKVFKNVVGATPLAYSRAQQI